jgi:hypothetical protein
MLAFACAIASLQNLAAFRAPAPVRRILRHRPPPLGTSDWEVNRNWSFTAIYMHFQPEKFLGETGPSK